MLLNIFLLQAELLGRVQHQHFHPYVRRNLRDGRLSGQTRLRIHYRRSTTPWFDFMRIAPDELEDLLDGTGWHVRRLLRAPETLYIAIIDRDP